jgi:pyruvate dehydrogenase E2 component (dihydrolipoamide acetyltransferase)
MDFVVPKLSATMESAKVLRWLKQVGDKVVMGEPLVELETDKAAMEVESPVDATIEKIFADEGAELPTGGVLARLSGEGDAKHITHMPTGEGRVPAATKRTADPASSGKVATAPGVEGRVLASPLAKQLAKINGIDLADLFTGRRIRKRDVLDAVVRGEEEPAGAEGIAGFEPLTAMRGQIARAVVLSRQTIPSFALDRWVETGAIERARALIVRRGTAANDRPTLTDFLLLALAGSFAAHPRLLDRWREQNGRMGRARASSIDIGIVVSLPDGLLIPVLRNLGGKTLEDITQARHAAVQRARSGRLSQADHAPVSFSLSNIGRTGADRFEAIINPGQTGILAVGRQHERVVSRAGAITAASGVNLTLSVDHRLVDGVEGARFLETLAQRIELGPWLQA